MHRGNSSITRIIASSLESGFFLLSLRSFPSIQLLSHLHPQCVVCCPLDHVPYRFIFFALWLYITFLYYLVVFLFHITSLSLYALPSLYSKDADGEDQGVVQEDKGARRDQRHEWNISCLSWEEIRWRNCSLQKTIRWERGNIGKRWTIIPPCRCLFWFHYVILDLHTISHFYR